MFQRHEKKPSEGQAKSNDSSQISQAKPSTASHAIQENSHVQQVKSRKSTHEPVVLDQHMLNLDKSSKSRRQSLGFVTTCSPSIHPSLSWCSSAPGVQERVRNELIEHEVPGVPVTPLEPRHHRLHKKP